MTATDAHKKVSYVGAPACFALEMACKTVADAFHAPAPGHSGLYIVGSALERTDWRDVDVRLMLDDDTFRQMFPDAMIDPPTWEFDPRWTLMVTSISLWMRQQTGLPIDFQFQPMSWANRHHDKLRHAAGLHFVSVLAVD